MFFRKIVFSTVEAIAVTGESITLRMNMLSISCRLLYFLPLLSSANCDWVEIPQSQDKIQTKSSGMKGLYTFPRNEYVYRQHFPTNKILQQTPNPPTTTFSQSEEIEDFTIETTSPLDTNTTPLLSTKIQDRMDDSKELNAEKLVGTSEKPVEDNSGNPADSETNTESFIPFLKEVQKDLTVKGGKNLKGKINMLMNLRDDLLLNIDERISQLWGGKSEHSSEAREHKEDDHDMHFPSNEGALMTIGFLTFAVFLIKLVLKLVQALKYKHSMVMVTPTVLTPNAAFIGRRKRDTDYDEQKKLLQFIDEYNLNKLT